MLDAGSSPEIMVTEGLTLATRLALFHPLNALLFHR